ncbi:serine protease inhibitor dipetalogastin-like [Mercenaria mercenaria]|uniref:serine protease inhibitor dipetalogastin-like n=1 Tax=Mercenaria mercenaria TaxID=6596 RepID=UPI00234EC402|nr:serine protease inhibitor dipetalogastin-like [Mercenaria mercenaria]
MLKHFLTEALKLRDKMRAVFIVCLLLLSVGVISSEDCKCQSVWSPVCGVNGITYSSRCEADCLNVHIAQHHECRNNAGALPLERKWNICGFEETMKERTVTSAICTLTPILTLRCKTVVYLVDKCFYHGVSACNRALVGSFNRNVEKTSDGECPDVEDDCICTMEYWPVCGADGKTYDNLCVMECANVELDFEGPCENTRKKRADNEEACICTTLHEPVCGKDGKTYDNKCMMDCNEVELDFEGPCENTRKKRADDEEACICTTLHEPVCGKDGKTYGNKCMMDCNEVELDFEGPCENTRKKRGVDKEICACTFLYEPVCGKDGKTYGNKCMMDCDGVQLNHEGECKEPECVCTMEYWPVCGKNGDTYGNMCEMKCAGIELDFEGPCEDTRRKRSFFEYEDCHCPKIYLPVCGSDDVTYPSQCVRKCAGVDLKSFGKCKEGEDDDTSNSAQSRRRRDDEDKSVDNTTDSAEQAKETTEETTEKPCPCPKIYIPMCGKDGVTYPNRCTMACKYVILIQISNIHYKYTTFIRL